MKFAFRFILFIALAFPAFAQKGILERTNAPTAIGNVFFRGPGGYASNNAALTYNPATGSLTASNFYGHVTSGEYRSISDFGPVGTSDDTATFQAASDAGAKIYMTNRVYWVSNIRLSNNFEIAGHGGEFRQRPSATGYVLQSPNFATNIVLRNFSVYGTNNSGGGIGMLGGGFIDGTGAGSRSGISLNSDGQGCAISDVYVHGFDGYGVNYFGTTNNVLLVYLKPKISTQHIEVDTCARGIWVESIGVEAAAEYFTLADCHAWNCSIGFGIKAGNVIIEGSHAAGNEIGCWVGLGVNSGHGEWTGGSLNHNETAIYSYVCQSGFFFSNLTINESSSGTTRSDIYSINGSRLKVQGCMLNIHKLSFLGTTAQEPNFLLDNIYAGTWANIKQTNSANFIHGGNKSFDVLGDTDGESLSPTNTDGSISVYGLSVLTNGTLLGAAGRVDFVSGVTGYVSSVGTVKLGTTSAGDLRYTSNKLAAPQYLMVGTSTDLADDYAFSINSEQFSTAITAGFLKITGKTNSSWTNIVLRGIVVPNLTASRALVINASGDVTNALGTASSSTYLDGTGNYTTPAGTGGGGGTSNLTIGIDTNTFVSGVIYTNGGSPGWVQSIIRMLSGNTGEAAGHALWIDQDGDGSLDYTNVPVSLTQQDAANPVVYGDALLGAWLSPGARFVFTNISSSGNFSFNSIRSSQRVNFFGNSLNATNNVTGSYGSLSITNVGAAGSLTFNATNGVGAFTVQSPDVIQTNNVWKGFSNAVSGVVVGYGSGTGTNQFATVPVGVGMLTNNNGVYGWMTIPSGSGGGGTQFVTATFGSADVTNNLVATGVRAGPLPAHVGAPNSVNSAIIARSSGSGSANTVVIRTVTGMSGLPFWIGDTNDGRLFSIDSTGAFLGLGDAMQVGTLTVQSGGPTIFGINNTAGSEWRLVSSTSSARLGVVDHTHGDLERVTINDTGQVGINNLIPTTGYILDVKGNVLVETNLTVGMTNVANAWLQVVGDNSRSNVVQFGTTNRPTAFVIKTNGNVGILTDTPAFPLSVKGQIAAVTGSGITPAFYAFGPAVGYGQLSHDDVSFTMFNSLSSGRVGFADNSQVSMLTVLNSNRRVGIGTIVPATSLDVTGGVYAASAIFTNSLKVGLSGGSITNILTASATLDFPSTAAGGVSDLPITVAGASDGDVVAVGVPSAQLTGLTGDYFGWASNGVVYIRFANNNLVSAQDPSSGTFKVVVTKF